MVKILKDPIELTEYDFSVFFIYANGCVHCENIKPLFEEMSEEFLYIKFLTAEINSVQDIYSKYAEKQPLVIDNVEVIDDQGNPVMVPKYVIPNFFIFAKELQSPEDEFGFAGGFDGGNPEELRAVLQALDEKATNG